MLPMAEAPDLLTSDRPLGHGCLSMVASRTIHVNVINIKSLNNPCETGILNIRRKIRSAEWRRVAEDRKYYVGHH